MFRLFYSYKFSIPSESTLIALFSDMTLPMWWKLGKGFQQTLSMKLKDRLAWEENINISKQKTVSPSSLITETTVT